jgi:predicted secreted protein
MTVCHGQNDIRKAFIVHYPIGLAWGVTNVSNSPWVYFTHDWSTFCVHESLSLARFFLFLTAYFPMNTTKIIAAIAFMASINGVFAQNYASPQNVVQLSANAAMEVQQDTLSISLNTTKDGTDAGAVQTQLKTALDAALSEAKKSALPGQMDVRTGSFSLYPRYSSGGKLNGWQGTAELVLEGKDFARISSTAGKIQTLTMGNVSFSLSREQREKAEAQVQATAIERFKTKAGEVAKCFGFGGYALREVAVNAGDQGVSPRPRMMAMAAKAMSSDEAVPVEAGKSSVVVTVSGSVQLK